MTSIGPGIVASVTFSNNELVVGIPSKFEGVKYTIMIPAKFATPSTKIRNGHVIRPFQSSARWLALQKTMKLESIRVSKPYVKMYEKLLLLASPATYGDISWYAAPTAENAKATVALLTMLDLVSLMSN